MSFSLFRWFSKKTTPPTPGPFFELPTVKRSDLGEHDQFLAELWARKAQGLIIEDCFSPEECAQLVDGFSTWNGPEKIDSLPGMATLPAAFSYIAHVAGNSQEGMSAYFDRNTEFWQDFPQHFGVNAQQRFQTVLGQLAGSRSVVPPHGTTLEQQVSPASLRVMEPGLGQLPIHCGNGFKGGHSAFYDLLEAQTDFEDQLSFFVMIQAPDSGGELEVFDLTWDQAQKKLNEDGLMADIQGQEFDLRDEKAFRRTSIRLQTGSMLVFVGGRYWHRVLPSAGAQDRVTMGGFLTRSKFDDSIHLWS